MAKNKESNVVLNFKMDGQVEYAKTIRDINAIMNAAASEYKTHIAAMGKDADQTKKLAAEKKKLEIQLEGGRERTKKLRAEYDEMAKSSKTTTAQLANKHKQLQNSERAEIALENALERVNHGLSEQEVEARKAEEALNKLEQESSELETQTEKLNAEYKLQQAQLGDNATESEKLALKMDHLNQAHEIAGQKVENYEQQLEQAKKQYGENSSEVDNYEIKLLDARTAEQELANEILTTNDALKKQEKSLEDVTKKLEETGKKMESAGKAMTVGVTAPIVGFGTAAYKSAETVDDALSLIRQTTGRTGDEMEELGESFKSAFVNASDSAEDVAGVMAGLNVSTEATGDILEELTLQTLDYAKVNREDASTSAETLGRLMNALDEDVSNMPDVMDKLTKASQMSGVGVNELSNYIIDAGPAFDELGFDLDRSIGLFANFYKVGAEPREVISSLGIVINNMAKEAGGGADATLKLEEAQLKLKDATMSVEDKTEALNKARSKHGKNSKQAEKATIALEKAQLNLTKQQDNVTKSQENMSKGTISTEDAFNSILQEIKDAPDILAATSIAAESFGGKVASKVAEDIRAGSFEVDEWVEALEASQGTVADTAADTESFGDKLANFRNKATIAFEPFGASLLDALEKAMNAFLPIMDIVVKVAEGFTKLPGPIQTLIIGLAGLVAAVGPLLIIAGKIVGAIGPLIPLFTTLFGWVMKIVPIFKMLGSVIGLLTNPIGWVVLAIGAIIGVLILCYNKIEWFRDFIDASWEFIKTVTSAVFGWIVDFLVGIWDGIKTIFTNVFGWLYDLFVERWNQMKEVVSAVFEFLVGLFKDRWEKIKEVFTTVFTWLYDLFVKRWNQVKEVTSTVFNFIKDFFSKIWNGIKTTVSTVVKSMIDTVVDNFNKVKDTATRIWNNIYDAINKPINKAKDAVSKAIETIKGLFDFKFKWPKLKMPKFSISGSMNPVKWLEQGVPKLSVKWNAKGAIFKQPTIFGASGGQLQGAGEAGPEAVLPLNEQTLGDIGKGIVENMKPGGGVVVQNMYVRNDQDIYKVSRELHRLERKSKKGRGG